MSSMSDLSIRIQEGEKDENHPTPKLSSYERIGTDCTIPKRALTINGRYWELCYDVIFAAGKVAQHEKLVMSYSDETKRHLVEAVVKKYFPSSGIEGAKKARQAAVKTYYGAIDRLNKYALEHQREQVSGMILLGMLENEKIREMFKAHVMNHIKNDASIFVLTELPNRDFR